MRRMSILLAIVAATLSACAQRGAINSTVTPLTSLAGRTVLVMPLDIELSRLQASGLKEPQAAWTASARGHMLSAIRADFAASGVQFVEHGDEVEDLSDTHVQLIKLHEAVGGSIVLHKVIDHPAVNLPTKEDVFDWTLGDDARELRDAFGADYAVFLHVRDSYTTAGRVAVQILAAILGVGVSGGQTAAYASVVDLGSGDVVWLNTIGGHYDLRDEPGSTEFVDAMFRDLPR